jgi:hypothetical protein
MKERMMEVLAARSYIEKILIKERSSFSLSQQCAARSNWAVNH